MCGGVVGVHADDVDLGEVLELDPIERAQLAADHEMQQLFGVLVRAHHPSPAGVLKSLSKASRNTVGCAPTCPASGLPCDQISHPPRPREVRSPRKCGYFRQFSN
jgi:hypothetical protein